MYNTVTIVMHSFAKETQMSVLHKLFKMIEEDENLLLLWHLFTNIFKTIIICLLLAFSSLLHEPYNNSFVWLGVVMTMECWSLGSPCDKHT
jgi:hypothetical protein